MKKLVLLIALVLLVMTLARLPESVVSDTSTLLADSNMPDNEVITSQAEAKNSSAIAMIMIAWTTPSGEGGSNEL